MSAPSECLIKQCFSHTTGGPVEVTALGLYCVSITLKTSFKEKLMSKAFTLYWHCRRS